MTIDPIQALLGIVAAINTVGMLLLGAVALRSKDRTSDADMVRAITEALAPVRTELKETQMDLKGAREELKQTQAELVAEKKRNDTNTQLIMAQNSRIDELTHNVEDYQALAEARGKQVIDLHGTPITLEQVKKNRMGQRRFNELMDDDISRAA
jgi:septal ring factor EnvC (AmiA/AmiB activator)